MKVWRIIFPSHRGIVNELALRHKCHPQTVGKALKFHYNSELAKAIREDCIANFGGKKTCIDIKE